MVHQKDQGASVPGTSADDEARTRDYLAGRAEVFGEVDRWIRGELRRRYPRLSDEHEDLAQSVHGKLLVNLQHGRYEGRSGLRTYVTGIAHRTAIDRLRGLYRDRALSESLAAEEGQRVANPYLGVEAREEIRFVHQVLMALPASCRQLWKLIFADELSYEEIGVKLSIPPGTVKSRMWHCRRKAQAALRRLRRVAGGSVPVGG